MRLLALLLLVVTGFMFGCAKQENAPAKASEATEVAVTPASSKLVMKVPTMSCPHGCWPTVKKTLEEQEGVASVELAKQSDEETIDKPEVTVHYNGSFDSSKAISALSESGFEGAEVIN
jgi:periplasmic mercuric ion binding protein